MAGRRRGDRNLARTTDIGGCPGLLSFTLACSVRVHFFSPSYPYSTLIEKPYSNSCAKRSILSSSVVSFSVLNPTLSSPRRRRPPIVLPPFMVPACNSSSPQRSYEKTFTWMSFQEKEESINMISFSTGYDLVGAEKRSVRQTCLKGETRCVTSARQVSALYSHGDRR